ncbi:hypothetical protein SPRG_00773, partial [Saprolegnia parasitica CBS 223.65]
MNLTFAPQRFHVGVWVFGLLSYVLYRGRVSADRSYQVLSYLSYLFFLLCVLDVALFHWHARRLVPLEPRAKGVAVVTGASSGLGREIAFALAEKGFNLVLVARTEATLERIAKEMRDVLGVTVYVCPTDLSSPESGVAAIEALVTKEEVEVDILVNCAGLGYQGAFHSQTRAAVHEMVAINVTALVQLTHALLPGMIARNRGRILNIASVSGASPMPTSAIYGATKAMVLRFSQSINYEVRRYNVGVTALSPGPIPTAFQEKCGTPQAVMFNVPMIAGDAKAAANTGVDAMLAGVETVYDSFTSEMMALGASTLGPKRIVAMMCHIMWNPPSEIPNAI